MTDEFRPVPTPVLTPTEVAVADTPVPAHIVAAAQTAPSADTTVAASLAAGSAPSDPNAGAVKAMGVHIQQLEARIFALENKTPPALPKDAQELLDRVAHFMNVHLAGKV